jgi:hypothetical protein
MFGFLKPCEFRHQAKLRLEPNGITCNLKRGFIDAFYSQIRIRGEQLAGHHRRK